MYVYECMYNSGSQPVVRGPLVVRKPLPGGPRTRSDGSMKHKE